MAKLTATNVSLYVEDATGASRSISGQGNSISLSFELEEIETTTFGSHTRERLPGGLVDWELTFDGFFDAASGAIGDWLYGILNQGGATFIQLGPAGSATGTLRYAASAKLTGLEIPMDLGDAIGLSATFVARAGSMTKGVWA